MKKDNEELEHKLDLTIKFIDRLVHEALALDCLDHTRESFATTIATQLRVLLNDEGRNNSLLSQVGIKDSIFYITRPTLCLNVVNMLTTANMVKFVANSDNGAYCMVDDFKPKDKAGFSCSFEAWWNEIVIDSKHEKLSHITRRDVVLVLADKEGGAHVDREYDEAYRQVKFEHGFFFQDGTGVQHPLKNDFFVESLFYIAQEFLYSFKRYKEIKGQVEYVSCMNKMLKMTYYREETGRKKSFSERWWFCGVNNRYDTLKYSFDYYQKAMYELFDLQIVKAELNDGNFLHDYYIDLKSPRKQIVYLRPNVTGKCIQMVVKFSDGYQIMNVMADIYNDRNLLTLDHCKALKNPDDPNDFDYWLERQWVDKPF